jgi:lactate permease
MMLILALTPILLLVLTLFGLKLPLTKAAPITFSYTLFLTWWKWDLSLTALVGVISKSGLLTLDLMVILLGAILFLDFLREVNLISPMQDKLSELSQDKRIQTLLLAWLFGSFLEGISGFGTPAAIIAPLMVSLGFAPFQAVILSLLANSTAVTFGAVGTPIRVGLASLDVSGVATQAALINLLSGWLVPVMMLAVVSDNLRHFKSGLFWAFAAGFIFLIPYYLFSFLGFEFPSLFGGAIGLAVAMIYLKPKKTSFTSLTSAFLPYLILICVLVVGKFIFSPFSFQFDLAPGLSHNLNLFNPGFAFLTVIFILNFKHSAKLSPLVLKASSSLQKTAVAIFFTSSLSYLLIQSGLLQTLSTVIVSSFLPFYAAALGAFGAFIAGSATVSNLLFGKIQFLAAKEIGVSSTLVLALQLVGAGIGNMIALSNILAVQAAVGMEGEEAKILKRLIIPCLIYAFVVGLWGLYLATCC